MQPVMSTGVGISSEIIILVFDPILKSLRMEQKY